MDFPQYVLRSSQGVPIFFEQYPDFFRPVSIRICVFSGGGDDAALAAPGLHHWGEHIPFRGTVAFPLGSKQMSGRVSELGGHLGAYTSYFETVYYGSAPRNHWREVAEIVVELAARPLVRISDVEAERKIIGQEINEHNADVDRRNYHMLRSALWNGHPLGGHVIGSHESLAATSPEMIHEMRLESYGLNRCALFVAGALNPDDVCAYLSEVLERMPDNPISERRRRASYGPLPEWRAREPHVEESEFDATVVSLVFPKPATRNDATLLSSYNLALSLISIGSLASPLYRVLREERQLVYSTNMISMETHDGGMIGLTASTSREKVSEVVDAFWSVLALPEIRSEERWKYVQKVVQARYDMHLPDPEHSVSWMQDDIIARGKLRTFSERSREYSTTAQIGVMRALDLLTQESGRVITLLGKK